MIYPARLLTFAALFALAGCISGTKPPDTYTDRNGTTTTIQTDAEQCKSSCNEEYSRCMETTPAQSNPVNAPYGMFGASSDCSAALRECLPGCKAR